MTFVEFIKGYKDDNSPLGDFANDALNDKCFPTESDYRIICLYLIRRYACAEARIAFAELWRKYRPDDSVDRKKLTNAQRKATAMFHELLCCSEKQALTIYEDTYGCEAEWNKGDGTPKGVELLNSFYGWLYQTEITRFAIDGSSMTVYSEDGKERIWDYEDWDFEQEE